MWFILIPSATALPRIFLTVSTILRFLLTSWGMRALRPHVSICAALQLNSNRLLIRLSIGNIFSCKSYLWHLATVSKSLTMAKHNTYNSASMRFSCANSSSIFATMRRCSTRGGSGNVQLSTLPLFIEGELSPFINVFKPSTT